MYKDPNDERRRASRRKHYLKNKEQYYKNNRIKKARMREFLDEVKNKPCADCKKKYPPFVMDFDHRDQKIKVSEVGKLLLRQSWALLKAEIEKCDLVCANCHRMRTAKQLNYGKMKSGLAKFRQ